MYCEPTWGRHDESVQCLASSCVSIDPRVSATTNLSTSLAASGVQNSSKVSMLNKYFAQYHSLQELEEAISYSSTHVK